MTIINMVPKLLAECKARPIDLVRCGLSLGVAYRWANDDVDRYDRVTLEKLCAFFETALSRPVDVGDLLVTERIQPAPETDAGRIGACDVCGQVLPESPGIGGEYPCPRCGVPVLHDSYDCGDGIVDCPILGPHKHIHDETEKAAL